MVSSRHRKSSKEKPSSGRGSSSEGGNLVQLPDLLQSIADTHRTGSLVLGDEGGEQIHLYFRSGAIIAGYDGDEDFLAKALVKTRAMTWEQLREFKSFSKAPAALLERLLLEQGRVDEEALRTAHVFVIRESLCEALGWTQPSAKFHDGPPLPELSRVNLPREDVLVPTKPLIMEGIYRQDEWSQVRELVPSDLDVPVRVAAGPQDDETKQEVFEAVDGLRSVREITEVVRTDKFTASCFVRDLVQEEQIRFLSRDELVQLGKRIEERGPEDRVRTKLMAIYERAEELGDDSLEVALWLAEAHEATGQLELASERYLKLGRRLSASPATQTQSTQLMRKALSLRPDDGFLQRNLIQTLIDQDRLEDAAFQAEVYVKWLRRNMEPVAALKAARGVLEQLQEFEEIMVLEAELAGAANNRMQALRLWRRIAEIRTESDEFSPEERVEALERVLEFGPKDFKAHRQLIDLLADSDAPRAIVELMRLIEHLEARPNADDSAVVEAYELLVRLNPSVEVAGRLALAFLDENRIEDGERVLRQVIEPGAALSAETLPPFKRLFAITAAPEHQLLYAQALLLAGDKARGIAELQEYGAECIRRKDRDAALSAYSSALEHDPFNRRVRMGMVDLLRGTAGADRRLDNLEALTHIALVEGDYKLASRVLREFIREDPDDLVAPRLLVDCRVRMGGTKALDALKSFVELSLSRKNFGDADWAVSMARELNAPPEWFKALPPPPASGRPVKPAGPSGPAR